MKQAVFLDRDGVINKTYIENGKPYPPKDLSELVILGGVEEAVRKLKEANYELIVVTNQPDIARKKSKIEDVEKLNKQIANHLRIEHFFVCPHDDSDNCECRKPKPGMLYEAAQKLDLDLKKSYFVGDRWKDIEAGQNAGCRCFYLNNHYSEKQPNMPFTEVSSLLEAADLIVKGKFNES